jgi:hypothetical protein
VIQVDPPQAYGIVQYGHTVAMLERRGWPRSAFSRMAATRCRSRSPADLVRAESYPGVFGDFGGLPTMRAARLSAASDRPGIGFEGQARLYRPCATLPHSFPTGG